jgi:phospholipid transport system substrate-binding protein
MMKQFKLRITLLASGLLLAGVISASTPVTEPAAAASSDTAAVAATTPAVPEDPIIMLREVSTNVLQALQQNKSPKDLKSIYALVDRYILPYVDFNEMSEWVAGRTIWNKASEQTRKEFISAFQVLVVRTYATALNSYTNEKVEFSKQHIDLNKTRIQISSMIVRQGKENIKLDYRLVKKNNKWYVYDIIIEGVSILQGFQAQFSDEIRQQGLQKVIAEIQQHNKERNA